MLTYNEKYYVEPYPNFYSEYFLLRTSDGGSTWEQSKENFQRTIHLNGNRWLATDNRGVLHFSVDDGLTWEYSLGHKSDGTLHGVEGVFIAIADSLPGKLYGVTNHEIFFSIDAGENFYHQATPDKFNHIPWSSRKDIICFPTPDVGYIVAQSSDSIVYKTIDGGGPALLSLPNIIPDKKFTVYPNPVSNEVYVEYDGDIAQLELFDALGRKIYQTTILPNTTSHTIDVQKFASGTYFIRLGGKSLKFLKY
jgi:hypothetical protein